MLPLPKSLKVKGGALTKTLEGLRKKDLLDEKPAARNAAAWREGEDGRRMMLVIIDAGLQAIGVDGDEKTGKRSSSTKPPSKQRSRRAERKPAAGDRHARGPHQAAGRARKREHGGASGPVGAGP